MGVAGPSQPAMVVRGCSPIPEEDMLQQEDMLHGPVDVGPTCHCAAALHACTMKYEASNAYQTTPGLALKFFIRNALITQLILHSDSSCLLPGSGTHVAVGCCNCTVP